ncbi:MAG TPA: hypothetical protein VKA27_05275, partial [Sunxiuqinia sp.]|nr:hypothetical protein [Sunxiuqinia sp.]
MKECNDHINSLVRDGTSQSGRYPAKLNPDSVKIDGRSESDFIDYAYKFAGLLNFYNIENQVDGDWQVFLQKLKDNPEAILNGEMSPQTALFLSFLRLFHKQQDQQNGLTKKHLDTFFRDVLRLAPKSAVADQIHVLFELAKNIDPTKLDAGTTLKAGKDAEGVDLFYQLTEDLVVNHATVEKVKSVLVDPTANDLVHFGEIANSEDGAGDEDLPKDDPKWPAFGKTKFATADVGFALASPILWLQEGIRTINVTLQLRADEDFSIPESALSNALKIYLSGEEEWLGAFYASPSIQKVSGSYQFKFQVELPETEKPVSYYNGEILDGDFQTIYPIMKIIPDTSSTDYVNRFFQGVVLENSVISVHVEGIKSLDLENDLGTLDASKTFMPFGPEPVKGSSFQIGYDEAFTKKLSDFKIWVDWLDVPSPNLYSYYHSSYIGTDDSKLNYSILTNHFNAVLRYRNKKGDLKFKTVPLFHPGNNQAPTEYEVNESGVFLSKIPEMFIQAQLMSTSRTKASLLLQN